MSTYSPTPYSLEDVMKLLHAAFVLCALVLPTAAAEAPKKTPLDDYLAKADPTYAWKLVKTIPGDGVTSYVLDLKSQTWRSTPEVDRPVWQHWLTIIKPDKVTSDTALLSIGGGRNGGGAPAAAPADAIDRARQPRCPAALRPSGDDKRLDGDLAALGGGEELRGSVHGPDGALDHRQPRHPGGVARLRELDLAIG